MNLMVASRTAQTLPPGRGVTARRSPDGHGGAWQTPRRWWSYRSNEVDGTAVVLADEVMAVSATAEADCAAAFPLLLSRSPFENREGDVIVSILAARE